MGLAHEDAQRLFACLEAAGWVWRERDTIYGPSGSIWLDRTSPWEGSLIDMYERMTARLGRIRGNREMYDDPKDYFGIERDTAILVSAPQGLVEGRIRHP